MRYSPGNPRQKTLLLKMLLPAKRNKRIQGQQRRIKEKANSENVVVFPKSHLKTAHVNIH